MKDYFSTLKDNELKEYQKYKFKKIEFISIAYENELDSMTQEKQKSFWNEKNLEIKQEWIKYHKQGRIDELYVILDTSVSNLINQERNNRDLSNKMSIKEIDIMNGIEFEMFLGELFKKFGYSVEFTKETGDQGVDLLIKRNAKNIAVQAKRYSSKVSNSAIQEVFSGMCYYGSEESMVITNSYYTTSAIEIAKRTKTILIDRDDLISYLKLF